MAGRRTIRRPPNGPPIFSRNWSCTRWGTASDCGTCPRTPPGSGKAPTRRTGLPASCRGLSPVCLPDPQMSIAASYGVPRLMPDDRIGVSLLYPAPGFLEERGSIGGRLVTSGRRAGGVPVRAVGGLRVRDAGVRAGRVRRRTGPVPSRWLAGRSGPPLGASDPAVHGTARLPERPVVGPAGRASLVFGTAPEWRPSCRT